MKHERKFDYVKVLQQSIPDCGWCDVCFYDSNDKEQMTALKSDVETYRYNERYPVRVISRRVPHGATLHA